MKWNIWRKIFLIVTGISCYAFSLSAQQSVLITGIVTDTDGEPMFGVYVTVKGTTIGVTSDANGKYTVSAPNRDAVLVFSFVGYATQEFVVGDQHTIMVTLSETAQEIEEIVVVGYGTQRKKDLTSSVVSVKSENFNQGAIGPNPLQLVEGKIAGLSITRNNGNDPNAGIGVQLRGVSTANGATVPLMVIDGIAGGDLNTVSPQDIASIDVLKDGSASAIYGTRGTNGVILITTKKGQTGAPKVSFDAMLSTEIVEKKLESLSAQEYWQYSQEHNVSIVDMGAQTNWFNELVKMSLSQMYNVSLSGGSNRFTYRASVSYKNQEGITIAPTTRETLNGRLSLSQYNWDDRLRFDLNLAYSNINTRYTSYAVFEQAVIRNPTWPVRNSDNTFYYAPNSSELDYNPVAYLYNHNRGSEYNKFMGDFRVTLEIIPGLKANLIAGIRKNMELTHNFEPSTSEANTITGVKGQADRRTNNDSDKTLEATFDYAKEIGQHRFSVIAGYSYQDFVSEYYTAGNQNFPADDYLWNNMETGSYLKDGKATISSGKGSSKLIAFFGRATYNFDDRYLLTATIRREGSSRFGANNKWGLFPAVSAGWRLSNESFLQGIAWLSDLKIRAGYGVTGNQMEANYVSIARMSNQSYVLNEGSHILSYGPSSNPNQDLKWEVKHETNFGFDMSVFNNRVEVSFDLYQRKNSDLLYQVKAPVPSLIHDNIWANVGTMKSNGVEAVLSGYPIRTKDLAWNISTNFSYNRSRLVSLSNDRYVSAAKYLEFGYLGAPGILGNTIRLEEGGDVGNFFGFHYLGLTPEGKWIFENLDDDPSSISEETDQKIIGNGVPKYVVGLTSSLTYKSFDFSISLKGAFKFDILNVKEIYYANPYTFPSNNLLKSALSRHKDIRDSPKYSDYYLEKGDYLKISNLTLGYNFNEPWPHYISRLRVFVSADNVFTFTKYTGIDPELKSDGFETGIDNREFYPRTRMFTLGLSITF